MFKKVLIANRGEIAVRVIRACRDLNISPVAVYSDADRLALHVRMADEAYNIGPAPAVESYLSIPQVLAAAEAAKVEAIHPGYGFLSENPLFARAVNDAGFVFIGPSPESMELMSSKTAARQVAAQFGAPIVPGTADPLESIEEAHRLAAEIGYPIMLKARAGGGGKGMRMVSRPEDLASALSTAQSEAAAAFKDSGVYIEKLITNPRHVEIQLLGDRFGNMVYLGERECSIQRRHQKVIEECPSPLNDPDLRERAGQAAIKVASAAGYYNAGTVEFLVDEQRNFYFLEMNTRLQVEHPVTELVTGIDLVREQLRIAAGEPLGYGQDDIKLRGHAIECRIYAEDYENNFMPASGRIVDLRPPSGPGIREDSGVYAGWEVPIYYDSMISKLVSYGRDRQEAITRLRRALNEYTLTGLKTTIPFFREILADEHFQRGEFDTGFIDRWLKERSGAPAPEPDKELLDFASVVAALHYVDHQAKVPLESVRTESKWKSAGRRAALHS